MILARVFELHHLARRQPFCTTPRSKTRWFASPGRCQSQNKSEEVLARWQERHILILRTSTKVQYRTNGKTLKSSYPTHTIINKPFYGKLYYLKKKKKETLCLGKVNGNQRRVACRCEQLGSDEVKTPSTMFLGCKNYRKLVYSMVPFAVTLVYDKKMDNCPLFFYLVSSTRRNQFLIWCAACRLVLLVRWRASGGKTWAQRLPQEITRKSRKWVEVIFAHRRTHRLNRSDLNIAV